MQFDESNYEELALRLKAIIETAIDGIITINRYGMIESINRAAANLFLYEPEEVIGQNISILMPSPHKTKHDQYMQRYHETGEAQIIGIGREVMGLKKDGSQFPFNLAVSEVKIKNRIIYTGIVHDLTEIKKAEKRVLALNEALEAKVIERTNELETVVNKLLKTNSTLHDRELQLKIALEKEKELNVLKSRFVSMASHEFRTPLSTILSSASLIAKYKDTEDNEKRLKHINRIKTSVDNLTSVLNDFLSLSKLEEGKEQVNFSTFNLHELCEETLDALETIKKNGQWIDHTYNDPGYVIKTDRKIMKNILFNLVSNAIKYSSEQGRIKCDVVTQAKYAIFTVTDDGIGIPQSEQNYMFERFFRASNAENIQGTGLGLNIVKSYLDLLRGNIWFESEEGRGTTFSVRIPNNIENE